MSDDESRRRQAPTVNTNSPSMGPQLAMITPVTRAPLSAVARQTMLQLVDRSCTAPRGLSSNRRVGRTRPGKTDHSIIRFEPAPLEASNPRLDMAQREHRFCSPRAGQNACWYPAPQMPKKCPFRTEGRLRARCTTNGATKPLRAFELARPPKARALSSERLELRLPEQPLGEVVRTTCCLSKNPAEVIFATFKCHWTLLRV